MLTYDTPMAVRKAAVIEYFKTYGLDIESEYGRVILPPRTTPAEIVRQEMYYQESLQYFRWQILRRPYDEPYSPDWQSCSDRAYRMSQIALSDRPEAVVLTDAFALDAPYSEADVHKGISNAEGARLCLAELLCKLEELPCTDNPKDATTAEYFESQFQHGVEEYRWGVGAVPELAGMLAYLLTTAFMHYESGMHPNTPTGKQCAETWSKLFAEMQQVNERMQEFHSYGTEKLVSQNQPSS